MDSRRFTVALSFPGEKRDFVSQVAEVLAAKYGKQKVLYDKYHEAEFARPNLDVHLPNLYSTQSELIAIFLCNEYKQKRWCNLEWRFIRQLIQTSEEDRIMFLSFDQIGAIPEIGILSGDGYVAIASRSSNEIASLILQRLHSQSPRAFHRDGVLQAVKKPVVITVLLPDDHESFGVDKADSLRSILAHEAGVDPEQIAILRTRIGSTRVDVALTEEAARALLARYATGQGPLRERGVMRIDAELPQEQGAKAVSVRMLRTAPWALVGRELELTQLDRVASEGRIKVLTLVALGGEGKTSLVAAWMSRLAAVGWASFDAVFDWSFYSQGTREDTQASSDTFLAEALRFFGDEETASSAKSGHEKGKRLAHLVAAKRALLILDGLEPLQYAPGPPMDGKLKDDGVAALLKALATKNNGLCIVTTRYSIPDLKVFWQTTASEVKLLRLPPEAGVQLLRTLGVKGKQEELERLVADVKGHALTLNLLGTYLRDAHGGDIRKRDLVKLEEADAEEQSGHAFRVMDAYVTSFKTEGENGQRGLSVLRLLGLFDRPASADCLHALWSEDEIRGLTGPLIGIADGQRNITLKRLQEANLITVNREVGSGGLLSLDAHPLVREYFTRQLRAQQPAAWRSAHRRLYEHLVANTHEGKEPTLEDLQPLYQAVAHGCLAGLHQEACDKVYLARILRGNENYSINKLGAFSPDLGAVACFFEIPWRRVSPKLTEANQAWLLNQAAFCLCALGRLTEALQPMQAALEHNVTQENWNGAAINANNLNELELTLGEVARALGNAEQSVIYADRSGDANWRSVALVKVADALHQAGRRAESLESFRVAEQMQKEDLPASPLLYSLRGFLYCDLLLAASERGAWQEMLGGARFQPVISSTEHGQDARATCLDVSSRAAQTLKIAERNNWLLDIALDHLTLGRAALYLVILNRSFEFQVPTSELDTAVAGLRRAGQQDDLPRGLLTRAWLRFINGTPTGPDSAHEDLDEAWEIAERGPMRLHMADIHLYRARLFHDVKPYPWNKFADGSEGRGPKDDLDAAEELINKCGYHRRDEELADAREAAKSW